MLQDSNLEAMGRLEELQRRFVDLSADIEASPEKEALSVLHAMIQETWAGHARASMAAGDPDPAAPLRGVPEIAELWRTAPP